MENVIHSQEPKKQSKEIMSKMAKMLDLADRTLRQLLEMSPKN